MSSRVFDDRQDVVHACGMFQVHEGRDRVKLSLRVAAARAGVSYVGLCRCERGEANPTVGYLEKLARVYGVTFKIGGK